MATHLMNISNRRAFRSSPFLNSHFRIVPLLLFHAIVFAQRPEIGFRIDFPRDEVDPVHSNSLLCGQQSPLFRTESAGRHFLIGLSVFLPVTRRLGLKMDPVYQRLSFSRDSNIPGNSITRKPHWQTVGLCRCLRLGMSGSISGQVLVQPSPSAQMREP